MKITICSLFFLQIFFVSGIYAQDPDKNEATEKQDKDNGDKNGNEQIVYEDSRLSRHKDLYFIAGDPNTKIQISFKVKILSNANVFLAYTQQMFWELGKESNPFQDVNFNPELFYRHVLQDRGFLRFIDLGIFEHKSNGKAVMDSRAWSRSYVKFNTVTKFGKWTFNWDTKIFAVYRFALDNANLNIQDYMGFWETKLSFFNYFDPNELINRAEIYFAFNPGGKYSQILRYGSQELGFRFRIGGGVFSPSIFFQIFHGYNESLITYNTTYWAYRVGFAF